MSRSGGEMNADGDLVCAGGPENEIWQEHGFESLKACTDRAIGHQIRCME